MTAATGTAEQLGRGLAFARLEGWRAVEVSGSDAFGWLNDIVTVDLAPLAEAPTDGRASPALRSLMLSPTGGVRAIFSVAVVRANLLLLQDPTSPRAVADLLAPYVLSSDVTLTDRAGEVALLAMPGNPGMGTFQGPEGALAGLLEPSVLSPSGSARGQDILVPAGAAEAMADRHVRAGLPETTPDAVETWRVAAAIPKPGVDVQEADLPVEAGLDDAVAIAKGCYLGQEAVARTRNLGRPRRSLLPVTAGGPVEPGDAVLAGDEEVGAVTSVAPFAGTTVALARVRWKARGEPLRTAGGIELTPREAGLSPASG